MHYLLYLAYLTSAAGCLAFRKQAVRPLTYAAAGFGGQFAMLLIDGVAEAFIYHFWAAKPGGGLLVSNALGMVAFFTNLGRVASIGALAWAVLCDRNLDLRRPGF